MGRDGRERVWDGTGGRECGTGQVGESVGWDRWERVWGGTGGRECGTGQAGESVGWDRWERVWGGTGGRECGTGQAGESVGADRRERVWDGTGGRAEGVQDVNTGGDLWKILRFWWVSVAVNGQTGGCLRGLEGSLESVLQFVRG